MLDTTHTEAISLLLELLQHEIGTIAAVLKFRKALALIERQYPFSYTFGLAEKREDCIESAQNVYEKLLLHMPGQNVLQFETLVLIAINSDGKTINEEKVKNLIKVFRPDRQGRFLWVCH